MTEIPSYFFPDEIITEVRKDTLLTMKDITNWLIPLGIIIATLI